jgi:hypothetical protein
VEVALLDGLSFRIPVNTPLPEGKLFLETNKASTEYYHRGIVSLDYTISSGALGEVAPGWDGLWTGLQPQSIIRTKGNNRPRCFVCSFDDTNYENELWEIQRYEGYDLTRVDQEILLEDHTYRPEMIPCTLETQEMMFQTPFDQKRIYGLDLHMRNMRGNLFIEVEFRNDGDPCWNPWEQSRSSGSVVAELCAPSAWGLIGETDPGSDGVSQDLPQRRMLRLGYPSTDMCDPTTTASMRLFFGSQLKFSWTGFGTWSKIRLMAESITENPRGGCWL